MWGGCVLTPLSSPPVRRLGSSPVQPVQQNYDAFDLQDIRPLGSRRRGQACHILHEDSLRAERPNRGHDFSEHERLLLLGKDLRARRDQPFTVHLSPETAELSAERNDIGRRLPKRSSVHYKHDPFTGEHRNAKLSIPIWSVPRPYVFHDFAITKNYSVIPEIQLVMEPLGMLFKNGHFMTFDPKSSARVGVISRDAALGSEMRWFDMPGFYPLHVCNAWEEKDDNGEVVLVGSCAANITHLAEKMELVHPLMELVWIDLKEGTVVRAVLSEMGLGFTAVNPTYTGKKTRYLYSGVSNQPPKISGVAKLDLELAEKRVDCVIATREFGEEVFGGEPVFVPRGEGDHWDEDDGFL